MSKIFDRQGFSVERATAFNEKAARSIGWKWALGFLDQGTFPFLGTIIMDETGPGCTPDVGFAGAVYDFQKLHGLAGDGMLGAGTWRRIIQEQEKAFPVPAESQCHVIKIAGLQVVLRDLPSYVHIIRDQYRFEKHGCFSPVSRRQALKHIVCHWGGLNTSSCFNALVNARGGEGLSSHLLIAPELDGTVLRIHQTLDLANVGWHCGGFNSFCVGLDICRHPMPKYKERYRYQEMVDNPVSGRGHPKTCVGMDPEAGPIIGWFIRSLAETLHIHSEATSHDHEVLNSNALAEGDYAGIIGHHHLTATKWDIAPWWGTLFGG